MFLLNVLVLLFAVVVYQNQDALMENMGLLGKEKICLLAKERLKNACCESSLSLTNAFHLAIPDGKHCYHVNRAKKRILGGCRLVGILYDEEYEKTKALLWTSGACSK